MTDEYEWGPWIEHDGKGCPCVGEIVQVEAIANRLGERIVHPPLIARARPSWFWAITGFDAGEWQKIIRYRIRRPRALCKLRELVENLPAHERERETT